MTRYSARHFWNSPHGCSVAHIGGLKQQAQRTPRRHWLPATTIPAATCPLGLSSGRFLWLGLTSLSGARHMYNLVVLHHHGNCRWNLFIVTRTPKRLNRRI